MRHRDEDAGGVGEGPVTRSAPRTPAAADGPAASPEAGALPFAFRITGSKLCRPPTRADAVYRRRLVELLLRETAPLILVSAPSGSGKTIAVSQWIEADARPSAWLQLDRGDNDPVTLLQYLARVLEDVAPVPAAVYSWLRLSRPPVAEAIVPALVFAAAAAPPLALVLDDVQRVSEPRSWAAAWPVLASLPDGSTVVVCGRADPPLPLARLRTEGQLAEFRFPELAFDDGEVAELVRLRGVPRRRSSWRTCSGPRRGGPRGCISASRPSPASGQREQRLDGGHRAQGGRGVRGRRSPRRGAAGGRRLPAPDLARREAVGRPVRRPDRALRRVRPAAAGRARESLRRRARPRAGLVSLSPPVRGGAPGRTAGEAARRGAGASSPGRRVVPGLRPRPRGRPPLACGGRSGARRRPGGGALGEPLRQRPPADRASLARRVLARADRRPCAAGGGGRVGAGADGRGECRGPSARRSRRDVARQAVTRRHGVGARVGGAPERIAGERRRARHARAGPAGRASRTGGRARRPLV